MIAGIPAAAAALDVMPPSAPGFGTSRTTYGRPKATASASAASSTGEAS